MKGREQKTRVGIVSADPMRVVGMEAILCDDQAWELELPRDQTADGWTRREASLCRDSCFEVIGLSAPVALQTPGLEIVVIDAEATQYLVPLILRFRSDRPKLRLLVLGPPCEDRLIEEVLVAGARGYLSYAAQEDEIKQAIAAVRCGSMWASRTVLASLVDRPQNGETAAPRVTPRFTRRERQVLQLLAQGFPNRDIGLRLGVDEGTVKAHVGRLMRKVGVVNRTALTMLSLERHLC